uniref:Cyclin-dependent kinase 2 homolog n=1 Tax=Chromera velia CCMP2878 TaxID=1169474 RepID=A0A0G4GMA2_9ALVE|mmetsp:Transcript_42076/g.83055  ORF Transcript_42076/g.83055 Transcript_42076/m.83055 type:complete len:539 (-) Transcript_42076:126-1742(-)|eukprot:Cvel_4901.t1-p1 / transcript=Cvel_4901.t1 / gene=Cvel_4901 / organism=Chromera_velia_CCMP2878 / gene_product=Cyclin-dependent kinase G-2, putative / transcript_product=Cyclin-dependent kinase G-2, putative / location=Cvel_scaffold221:16232-21943(+) / protein_length=538 / sequence_SO=supercontig / SO=protein_coding / is_pseudo=false
MSGKKATDGASDTPMSDFFDDKLEEKDPLVTPLDHDPLFTPDREGTGTGKRKRETADSKATGGDAEAGRRASAAGEDGQDDDGKEDLAARRASIASSPAGGIPCPSPTPSVGGLGLDASGLTGAVEGEAHNPLLHGCRKLKNAFKIKHKISEGTYGVVYSAVDVKTGERVALKQMKVHPGHAENGFPLTSIREICLLLTLRHENLVNVKEVCVGDSADSVWMVMEYLEHELKDLLGLMKDFPLQFKDFRPAEIKSLLFQLISAVEFMHSHWVVHRDLKTTNLLYSNNGILKVCDFGLARQYGDPVRNMTATVVTMWYRAPEVLAGIRSVPYTQAIDMWSVGCIFAELFLKKPLFEGVKTDLEMLGEIFKLTGLPDETSWPSFWQSSFVRKLQRQSGTERPWKKYKPTWREKFPPPPNWMFKGDTLQLTDKGLDLLKKMMALNPQDRISAAEALNHDYFRETPAMTEKQNMPKFDDSNAKARSRKDRQKSVDQQQQEERERYHLGIGRYDSAGAVGVDANAFLAAMEQQDRDRRVRQKI